MVIKKTKLSTITAAIAAIVLIVAIVSALPSAMAQQDLAPGQTECNPGQSDSRFCGPPGQNNFNNPGQCQKTFDRFLPKELAHDICHTS